jgi:hypothetical protein
MNNYVIFFNSLGERGDLYKFSSLLKNIGIEFDVEFQNESYVEVISDPVEIDHPKYGLLSVTKVRADVALDYHTIMKEFWVPTICLLEESQMN